MTQEKSLVGKAIGRYVIKDVIGKGNMGVVYLAKDPNIGRMVAIKTIKFDSSSINKDKEIAVKRLFHEARAVGKLTHPSIVTVYDVGQSEDVYYIAMEYLRGGDLSSVLSASKGPFSVKYACEIIKKIAAALSYAHQQGIVHRDIKPANIMLLKNGDIKVMDFGIARMTVDSKHQQSSATLTMDGMIVGSPSYMSPEQAQGLDLDKRTDIFSLGVIFYEMLTKKKPFTGAKPINVLFNIIHSDVAPPSQANKKIPIELENIILKAMEKEPSQRFQTCSDLLESIEDFEKNLSEQVPKKENKSSSPGEEKIKKLKDDGSISHNLLEQLEMQITDKEVNVPIDARENQDTLQTSKYVKKNPEPFYESDETDKKEKSQIINKLYDEKTNKIDTDLFENIFDDSLQDKKISSGSIDSQYISLSKTSIIKKRSFLRAISKFIILGFIIIFILAYPQKLSPFRFWKNNQIEKEYRKALNLYEKGRHVESSLILKNIYDEAPEYVDAYFVGAAVAIVKEKYDEANQFYLKSIGYYYNLTDRHYRAFQDFYLENKYYIIKRSEMGQYDFMFFSYLLNESSKDAGLFYLNYLEKFYSYKKADDALLDFTKNSIENSPVYFEEILESYLSSITDKNRLINLISAIIEKRYVTTELLYSIIKSQFLSVDDKILILRKFVETNIIKKEQIIFIKNLAEYYEEKFDNSMAVRYYKLYLSNINDTLEIELIKKRLERIN